MKYKAKFEMKMSHTRQFDAENDKEADEIVDKIADNLEADDFSFDPAYIEITDLKIIPESKFD